MRGSRDDLREGHGAAATTVRNPWTPELNIDWLFVFPSSLGLKPGLEDPEDRMRKDEDRCERRWTLPEGKSSGGFRGKVRMLVNASVFETRETPFYFAVAPRAVDRFFIQDAAQRATISTRMSRKNPLVKRLVCPNEHWKTTEMNSERRRRRVLNDDQDDLPNTTPIGETKPPDRARRCKSFFTRHRRDGTGRGTL